MMLERKKVNANLYFWIIFLTFLGYYAVLVLIFNLGFGAVSRSVTIPLRLLITGLLLVLFLFNINNLKKLWEIKLFYFFVFCVIIRVLIDFNFAKPFYLGYPEFILYFFSFSVLPFTVLARIPFNLSYLRISIKAITLSGFSFSLLVVWFYSRFVGQVSRLSSNIVQEDVVSPLALSYSSSLIIGVLIFYFLYNKSSIQHKILGFSAVVLSFVPFFLGASRGSLIGLLLPFLILIYFDRKKYKKNIFLIFLTIISIVFLDEYFQSGLLNRFLGITTAIEEGRTSAIRLDIWRSSLNQFLANPFFGDKLEMDFAPGYAHNFFIEVLQSLGFLGFIPFLLLVLRAWKLSFIILKNFKTYSWVVVIFIQAFCQGMFSGTIYSAAWFWVSIAILFSLYNYLKSKYSHKVDLIRD